jgi:hypothetical protein
MKIVYSEAFCGSDRASGDGCIQGVGDVVKECIDGLYELGTDEFCQVFSI